MASKSARFKSCRESYAPVASRGRLVSAGCSWAQAGSRARTRPPRPLAVNDWTSDIRVLVLAALLVKQPYWLNSPSSFALSGLGLCRCRSPRMGGHQKTAAADGPTQHGSDLFGRQKAKSRNRAVLFPLTIYSESAQRCDSESVVKGNSTILEGRPRKKLTGHSPIHGRAGVLHGVNVWLALSKSVVLGIFLRSPFQNGAIHFDNRFGITALR